MRVKGEGPLPCDLMFIGEGPGVQESLTGRPFVDTAPAGAELTRYTGWGGVPDRWEIYITNLVKEWSSGATKPKTSKIADSEILKDEWELKLEILSCQPTVIVTLGGYATRWLLGPKADMNTIHGLTFRGFYCSGCGTPWLRAPFGDQAIYPDTCGCHKTLQAVYVVPIVHPAAGLHRPEMAAQTAYDFGRLRAFLEANSDIRELLVWEQKTPGMVFSGVPETLDSALSVALDSEGQLDAPHSYSLAQVEQYGYFGTFEEEGDPDLAPAFLPQLLLWAHYQKTQKGLKPGSLPLTFHAAQWDCRIFQRAGHPIPDDLYDDTMIMAYLLGIEPQGLKELALRHLGLKMTEFEDIAVKWEDQYGKPSKTGKPGKLLKKKKKIVLPLSEVPKEKLVPYAGADAMATAGIKPLLWERIREDGLETVYGHDLGMVPIYAQMEDHGLPVDMDHMKAFGEFLAGELDWRKVMMVVTHNLPEDFNPDNPAEVGEILYGVLKVPGGKKTPSGKQWATEDKTLQAIKGKYPFVQDIIDYREIQKLKSTFVDSLSKFVGPDLRLRFRLLSTRVVSGRPAAKDPNVLALPKHSKLAKRFRAGIRSTPGRLLGSWDFNQIELRVLAVDSGSTYLQQVFRDGLDLHVLTASKIFGVPALREAQDDSLHRLPAKTTNFSIVMGTTGYGLAEQMRAQGYAWPELAGKTFPDTKALYNAQREVCQSWIDDVIELWGIGPYIQRKHLEAKSKGFVTDMWGRRRYLPMATSTDPRLREEALRQAQAFGPQAGARGVYKQAVKRVWAEVIRPLQMAGHYIVPCLDIHDDLLLEFEEGLAAVLKPVITSIMETTVTWPIPIVVSAKTGPIWSEL